MTSTKLNYPPREHIHFVGIGGTGMSGIAEVLLNLGYIVSGSDLNRSSVTERLLQLGARVSLGHDAGNLGEAQVVVASTAVGSDNVEVAEAHRRGLPVIPRAEMLAELMRLKYGVAVAGSHGKTTTTSLISAMLAGAGLDPTFVVGGRVNQAGANARLGKGELIVVEADESDGSFLMLSPVIAVVTNIDYEHMDHYRDFEELKDAFVTFVNKVPFYGAAILCIDDENVRSILPRIHRRVITYSTETEADFTARDIKCGGWGCDFTAWAGSEDLGRVRVPLAGLHHVKNSLAAIAVAQELNANLDAALEALEKFSGVGRRFEVKAKAGGATLVDDYGHHPVEIRATLEAASHCGFERLVVLFQPHRYTRTQHCWNEFLTCFAGVDELHMVDIYPASEEPIQGVTGESLAAAIHKHGHVEVEFHSEMKNAVEAVLDGLKPGDGLLTIGAGSVARAAEEIAERLPAAMGVTNAG
jgi:UDP-N-acetylmuramate--alanine ligase